MIFVTVGTHEDQFDRLIQRIDLLVGEGKLKEKVFIQSGYSNYTPRHCEYSKLIGYDDMVKKCKEAEIIITHGGPGSIMLPLAQGKIPIVVPRQTKFGEHVDDHQVLFTKRLESENKVLAVYDIRTLDKLIINYENYIEGLNQVFSTSNLDNFVNKLEVISKSLLNKNKS